MTEWILILACNLSLCALMYFQGKASDNPKLANDLIKGSFGLAVLNIVVMLCVVMLTIPIYSIAGAILFILEAVYYYYAQKLSKEGSDLLSRLPFGKKQSLFQQDTVVSAAMTDSEPSNEQAAEQHSGLEDDLNSDEEPAADLDTLTPEDDTNVQNSTVEDTLSSSEPEKAEKPNAKKESSDVLSHPVNHDATIAFDFVVNETQEEPDPSSIPSPSEQPPVPQNKDDGLGTIRVPHQTSFPSRRNKHFH